MRLQQSTPSSRGIHRRLGGGVFSKVAAAGGIALLTKPFPANALIEAIVKATG
jgi:hypothetical protein